MCKCGCGLPMKQAHVDEPFAVESFKCYAAQAVRRVSRQAIEDAKRNKAPEGWDDGLFYIARPATTEEDRRGD